MQKSQLKAYKVSSQSISSSSNSSTSSSVDYQQYSQQTPKPPEKNKPESSKIMARQRAIKNKANNHFNENLIDTLNLNDLNPSRPSSTSSLSKYKALPQIVPSSMRSNLELVQQASSKNEEILIGIRLPDGSKKQRKFYSNTKIKQVLEYAIESLDLTDIQNYSLLQMPNLLIDNLEKNLAQYEIKDRSMLFVIDKNLL